MTSDEEHAFAESNGWKRYEHAGDAVGLTDAEKQEMDFRIGLANAVRKRRETLGLTQKELGKRLKVGVRQVARIELGNFDVPLEQILRAYSALGGRIGITELPPYSVDPTNGATKARKKKTTA